MLTVFWDIKEPISIDFLEKAATVKSVFFTANFLGKIHLFYGMTPPHFDRVIGLMSRVFGNGPGDWDLILGQVIPKTQKKMVLDATLLNTQHYKVWIKGKVDHTRELRSVLP